MDSKSVYQSIVEMLYNTLKNEKTRTKILFDADFKAKIIVLVDNLLSLEVDHEATFKDNKWSTAFAKAVVNISKEKLKFEKPENKSISDCYADYADTLTYCFNTYEIDRSVLTSTNEAVEEDKIKEFKITDELKTKYSEDTIIASTVEVVDEKVEKPNTQQGFGSSSSKSGFESFGQSTNGGFGQPFTAPIPPMQDPRFYPYKSKPKYMKWLKIALGATFGILGAILIVINFVSMYVGATVDINPLFTGEPPVLTWTEWNKDITKLPFSISIFTYLGYSNSMAGGGWLFIILYAFMIAWITYNMIAPAKRYREQFVFPLINIIAPIMLIIFVLWGYIFNSFAFKGMTGNLDHIDFIARILKSNKIIIGKDQYDNFVAFFNSGSGKEFINTLDSQSKFGIPLLWIQFIFAIASIIFTIVVIMLNPKLDREKVAYANNEFQTMINEALQGRKHEIDPSIYEDQAEIDAFYQKIRDKQNRKNNRHKDDE
ncbi:hypothetical protein [Spiroplasma culicicola]|uniref:Transmembrane protein n=1 Tax=Spiroplasma culicicola AES-1 TaxID=1276246 RepID=W6A7S5_9MOLU|nr:hypothetical protein [Spiroplasma culicicola]AHI52925.1 hypothetical protein SCULI_v1c05840 [Spiroplasma culicicola AES-1]